MGWQTRLPLTRCLREPYANLTRILRGLHYQPHIFGPIIPATVLRGWRNRDVYLVIQTCLMQQRVVVVVVVAAAAAVVVVGSNNNNWSRLPSHQSGIVQSMGLVAFRVSWVHLGGTLLSPTPVLNLTVANRVPVLCALQLTISAAAFTCGTDE